MKALGDIVVTEINNVMTVFSERGRVVNMKNRATYGLSFCVDGQITYTHNGTEYISDPNHAVILPKGQSYTLYGDKNGFFPLINFDCIGDLCDSFVVIPIEDSKFFINDYERIKALSLFEGNNAKILSIFYGIIDRLASHSAVGSTLMPAISYIEKNYNNPGLSNNELARECRISEVYLRKLFVQQLKITPRQFIIDIRIQKAKQLLSEGALKINAVSDRCGFSNPYHFCRIFKDKTGLTPTDYAKQNRVYKI